MLGGSGITATRKHINNPQDWLRQVGEALKRFYVCVCVLWCVCLCVRESMCGRITFISFTKKSERLDSVLCGIKKSNILHLIIK